MGIKILRQSSLLIFLLSFSIPVFSAEPAPTPPAEVEYQVYEYEPLPPPKLEIKQEKKGNKWNFFGPPPEAPRTILTSSDDVLVGYKLGQGFFFKTPKEDYSLHIAWRLMSRYHYSWLENQTNESTFEVNSLRLKLYGNAFSPKLKWFTQTELYKSVVLKDAFLEYTFVDELTVKGGQTSSPVCREAEVFSGTSNFINNAIAINNFCPGRDIGIDVSGDITKWFTYATYVYNGEGTNRTNQNEELVFGARIMANLLGEKIPYKAGDFDYSRSPRLALGAAFHYNTGNIDETTTNRPNDTFMGTTDLTFLFRGLYLDSSAFYLRNMTLKKIDLGFSGRLGYFILPKRLDFSIGASTVIPDSSGTAMPMSGVNKTSTIPVYDTSYAINYYIFGGHEFKIQSEYRTIFNKDGIKNLNDNILTFQLVTFF
ncbi:MAG: porin [bacterium]|nr:porin [bacterium]